MTTATTPTLAGTTLPMPYEAERERTYRGGTLSMADGSIVHDLVDSNARHTFSMRWRQLTATQLASIETAYAAVKDTTGTLKWVNNVNYTVTRPDNGTLRVRDVVTAGGQIAYEAEMQLIEDS